MSLMAMNLRLPPETAEALKERSSSTGRSQQELIREAVENYLGLTETDVRPFTGTSRDLIARGLLRPPDSPYREATTMITLPEGVTSLDLLQREDRF
jgi:hypothetical protein